MLLKDYINAGKIAAVYHVYADYNSCSILSSNCFYFLNITLKKIRSCEEGFHGVTSWL